MLGRDLDRLTTSWLARCDMTFIAVKLQIDTYTQKDIQEMWKRLGRADLEQILSEDETQKLAELSRPDGSDPVQEVIDLVADLFRGALGAKGHELDVRAHYVPPEYAYAVLVYSRWSLWTRFPMSPSYANDEARKSEYEFA